LKKLVAMPFQSSFEALPSMEHMNDTLAKFLGFAKVNIGLEKVSNVPILIEANWQPVTQEWIQKSGIIDPGVYYLDTVSNSRVLVDAVDFQKDWRWLAKFGIKIREVLAAIRKVVPKNCACQGDLIDVDIHCAVRIWDHVQTHKEMYKFAEWYLGSKFFSDQQKKESEP